MACWRAALSAPEQFGWAWCNQCQGMWYPPNGGDICPYRDDLSRHSVTTDYTSYNYGFHYDAEGSGWQEGWLWCHQCSGMFWSGSGTSAGVCPYGQGKSAHDGSASGPYSASDPYVAYRGTASGTGQPGWSWCSQCSGLWFSDGATTGGICPVDLGTVNHTAVPSSNYLIPHSGTLQMGPGEPD